MVEKFNGTAWSPKHYQETVKQRKKELKDSELCAKLNVLFVVLHESYRLGEHGLYLAKSWWESIESSESLSTVVEKY